MVCFMRLTTRDSALVRQLKAGRHGCQVCGTVGGGLAQRPRFPRLGQVVNELHKLVLVFGWLSGGLS